VEQKNGTGRLCGSGSGASTPRIKGYGILGMEKEAILFSNEAPPVYGPLIYERQFPSEPSLVPAVVFRLVDFLSHVGFISPDHRTPVMLCVDEGLKNAMLHGNEGDASRSVTIRIFRADDCFWILISDEGKGFDREKVPNPFDEEGLWREGGRGIHLMQYYAKAVEYWDGGSTLALAFPLDSQAGKQSTAEETQGEASH